MAPKEPDKSPPNSTRSGAEKYGGMKKDGVRERVCVGERERKRERERRERGVRGEGEREEEEERD